ncbi:MAG: Gfo/Idh/MocA family oxidoreductase [Chloroflexota bacterium]|nr:MAG: Gfo/Idh/MocA family oxidoreductase [Chloroflexota bacterium]
MAIRIAQYGTGHGHASGKWLAMRRNADVAEVGVYEPDPAARAQWRSHASYEGARWYESADEMLGDASIDAIAIEGRNDEGLAMARPAIDAGKHVWYDKPAGDDWPAFLDLVGRVCAANRVLQMGYMLRYHDSFKTVADWARGGMLGHIFQIRAHFSTNIPIIGPANTRELIARHRGGMLYDLGGHMLDQVTWILGRPTHVTAFLHNHATPELPHFPDNTLGVFEFNGAMATVEIAAMEARPMARRFEVYGTRGSAILLEPFEPGGRIRLALDEARNGFVAGEQIIKTGSPERQALYERELAAFVATTRGQQAPDRDLSHEVLVQETLLRVTGGIPGG